MNRNIILKTFDEVRYFRKRLIFAIELKEKVTFLILSNEPIFDIETLRNYLIENELNQFAKNEIINLIELIDSFLKLKIKYEAVPKSENHFSYEYPNKGKGVGGGNLMYVLKVNDNFLKVNEATFSEKEPLYSRFTSLNCFKISSRLLEIKDLFATYLEQPQQPEHEAIDTTPTEKIKLFDANHFNNDCYKLFNYLVDNYKKKGKIKFINIYYFLKDEVNKQKYSFNFIQDDYTIFIKTDYQVEIKKYQKAEFDFVEQKRILNAHEEQFRKQ